jgi:peptidoglycan/LPS O-acetylase OafA/YrhL
VNAPGAVVADRQRDRILDAWRGVSVILVILHHAIRYHFGAVFAAGSPSCSMACHLRPGLYDFFSSYTGVLGVQCFFVISGYIITKLLLQEVQANGRVSLSAFYVRRAFRILPPLWMMLSVTYILVSLNFFYVAPQAFRWALLFLTNFHVLESNWPVSHTWSLGVEEQFYIFWPLLLLATVRSVRGLAVLAAGLSIAFAVLASLHRYNNEFDNDLSFACITAGCFYAASMRCQAFCRQIAIWPVVLVAWILVFGRPLLPHLLPGQGTLFKLLQAPLVTFVIFSSLRYRRLLEGLTVVQLLAGIGVVSYGVYLWQQLFLAPPDAYRMALPWEFILLCPLVVWLSYRYLERPAMRLGSRLSRHLIAQGKLRGKQRLGVPT